jgi:broad specificity polyphosphatase/5'/3'-nucleotidase SurE
LQSSSPIQGESWTLWRGLEGSLEGEGKGEYQSPSDEAHSDPFTVRLTPRAPPAAEFARTLIPLVLAEGLPPGILLNVNVPQAWTGAVRFTRQSSKITRNVQPGADPRGRKYFWLHEQQLVNGIEPDTDLAAVPDGAISIAPLELDRTHNESLDHLSRWTKLLESVVRK